MINLDGIKLSSAGPIYRILSDDMRRRNWLEMTERSYLKGKHILAVDDEKDILEIIIELLEDATIDTAQDYQAAMIDFPVL